MKRLYYLTDTMESTESIADDLHKAGVVDWNFHVLSKQRESGLYRRHIHSANWFHKSDIIHSLERGIIFGLGTGALLAWVLSIVPVFGDTISGAAVGFVMLFSVFLGGWLGGFIGIQTENYKIRRFHDKLEQGYFLIMVDVEVGQEDIVREVMSQKHQEANFATDGSSVVTPFHQPKSI
ncbi:hypothetical protein [Aliikangiella sp. G2MR2-5]|uniref:hypothetical protein n=1 Tax=Aliikangiella sp. G2MR2-5 TaxID=2788943 RepID=UPI0018AADD00|nr:hypothetical protein [Aliikangiella sp. G2MR2-5]